jgi:hypothetical protein
MDVAPLECADDRREDVSAAVTTSRTPPRVKRLPLTISSTADGRQRCGRQPRYECERLKTRLGAVTD